jgi:tetratricopeptide (TPR) repeat protein
VRWEVAVTDAITGMESQTKSPLVDETYDEISHLRNRLDSLEEANRSKEIPWYKNMSTIIAATAFLFSFGTTILSYKRNYDQDVQSQRSQLIGILQRIASLPKENLEEYNKYRSDAISYNMLSGFINQENQILSKQAEDIIKRLPKEELSATDYNLVGGALVNSRNFDAAVKNFESALDVAVGLDDEVGALRNLANLQMVTGHTGDARANYQRALDIFAKYPGYDEFTKNSTTVYTELAWAWSEAAARNLDLATQHLTKADQIVAPLPAGSAKEGLMLQVAQARSTLLSTPPAATNGSPTPAPGLQP